MTSDTERAFLDFDEKESRRVEAIYQTPDVVAQRARVLDALALRPGERVVDLGCGPGLLASQMAQCVGPEGEIECIDASGSMVALARHRCTPLNWVHLRVGDVAALPYADRGFDAAVCTQVYEYLPELDRALAHLYRVLRPGGRAVIVDTDWESCVWHSSDPARMRRMLDAWDRHCPQPQLPRTLAARLQAVGFESVRVDAITLINDRYDSNTYSFSMIPVIAGYAAKHGLVSGAEVEAWVADLQALGRGRDYFFSLNRYSFMARKPATAAGQ
ncbi:MAG TPA: class I SAM-dependent methyltransferase [Burkholderiales bacterium]|nr:class I SAM-dependent methyltransferase [Burkholderiales bacterium]